MRKRFIGVWSDGAVLHVSIEATSTDVLRNANGRISALVPATPEGAPAELPETGALVFISSNTVNELLATLTGDLGEEIRDATYLSHGHASVVLVLREQVDWAQIYRSVQDLLSGYEIWPIRDKQAPIDQVEFFAPSPGAKSPLPDISDRDLNFEAAAQLRQFNANLALLARNVSAYAPEIWPLIESLHDQVEQIAERIRNLNPDVSTQPDRISSQTVLIETNAVVTLYCSQLGSGTFPLYRSTFPVGEYSLLGIGGMCRAAWRLYEHLNIIFARFDHPSLVRNSYPILPAFDPFGPSSARRDFSTWRSTNFSLSQLPEPRAQSRPRFHVPYFSSRWGFHESLHSISLSWQCLYASATKEWNLLTVTHEFLHAQVRAIFAEILKPQTPDIDLAESIVSRYNARTGGENARDAMQVAFAEALVVYRAGAALARSFDQPDGANDASDPIERRITVEILHELMRDHTAIVHEIAVHVLDYRYVYEARDAEYVESIWSSWSLVPGVSDQVEHYVLRTVCALSAISDLPENASNNERFNDARTRMITALGGLLEQETARPAILAAKNVFDDPIAYKRVKTLFNVLRYVVELTQIFFYDSRLNTSLMTDSQTDRDPDSGRFVYQTSPGVYEDRQIESPVGFLLDMFPRYSTRAGSDEVEFQSIWQMFRLL